MVKLQSRPIRGIAGNWDHIWDKHGITEDEVVSVFKSGPLRPRKNKRMGRADYVVSGRTFTGRWIKICYAWDEEKRHWIWVHTAF